MNTLRRGALAATLLLAPVAAQRLIAFDTSRWLVALDPQTGARTQLVRAAPQIGTPSALAYDEQAGVLFASSNTGDALFTVDLITGATTQIGSYGDLAVVMHGLEYDSTHNQLYGCSSHNSSLYAIDRTTGVATLIGPAGIPGTLNLAHDSRTDTLYGTSTGGDSLYVVNRQTGAFTLIGNLQTSGNPQGLAFDRQLGVLWLVDNAAQQLLAVDTSSGRAYPVGPTGVGNLLGLAHLPAGLGGLQRQAHGCGAASIFGHGSARIGGGIAVQLDGITGLPFVGFGLSPLVTQFCGCAVGHDWLAAVPGSSAVLAIPADPALNGAQIGIQGCDLNGAGSCGTPQFGLTDTLRLTIG